MIRRFHRNQTLLMMLCLLAGISSNQFTHAKAMSPHASPRESLCEPSNAPGWSSGTRYEDSYTPVASLSGGMASYNILTRMAAVSISDDVLSYVPPAGSAIVFTSIYDHSDALAPIKKDYSNLGAGWNFNWSAFLHVAANGVTVNIPGGGIEYYPIFRKQGQSSYFKHNVMSHAILNARSGGFERQLPDGSLEIYNYQGKGGRIYLSEIRDPSGNAAKVGYDQWFRVRSITDLIGQVSKIGYASDEPSSPGFYRVLQVTDPFGREGKFGYTNDYSQLLSSSDTIGLVSKYSYASTKGGVVTSLVTPYGQTKFRSYKPAGSPEGSNGLKITHPDGSSSVVEHWTGDRHVTYQWNRIATSLYPDDPQKGNYTHCTITKWLTEAGTGKELSIKASTKEPLESEVVYGYQGQTAGGFRGSSNLPVSISRRVRVQKSDGSVDTSVQTNRFQYNSFGHLVRKVDPLGRTYSFLFNDNDIDLHEVRQTGAGSNVLIARYEYNRSHNPVCIYDASGNATRYEYNRFGQITKTVAADKSTTTRAYDSNGRVTAIYGPLSDSHPLEKLSYDKFGHVQSATDVDGKTIIFEYDQADRVTKKLFTDGTNESFTYDKLNVVAFKDRAGRVSKRQYDNFGRTIVIEDPSGRKTAFEWCLCGALRKLTDPSGHSKEWHHDIQGRVIQEKFANGSEIKFEYEPDGHRLLSKTDALKQITKFSYNLDDSISERSYANTINPMSPTKFTYDPKYPLPVSAENSLGRVEYRYAPPKGERSGPAAGRIQSISNSAIPNSTISFEFDPVGRIATQSINGAENKLSFSYDPFGRMTSTNSQLGEFKYQYADDNGKSIGTQRIASIRYPKGSSVEFDYMGASNLISRIKNIAPSKSPLCQFEYLYDQNGLLSKSTEQFGAEKPEANGFAYDTDGQLIEATLRQTGDSAARNIFRYEYDSSFNRIRMEKNGLSSLGNFNNTNELLEVKPGDQSSSRTASTFTYDLNGNLLSDSNRKYKWDAENRLIRIDYSNNSYSEFFYNALGQLEKDVEVSNGKVTDTRIFIWCDERICEERNGDGTPRKKFYAFGVNRGGKNLYYFRDQLGSTRLVADEDGADGSRLDYDPFGNIIARDKHGVDFQYGGYYKHAESGLYLTLFRVYDSSTGRWLNRDPLGELGEAGKVDVPIEDSQDIVLASNLYSYVGNRVTAQFDPLGLQGANASGSATRQPVSDTGQNAFGRIWYISYTGASQGVTYVNQQPTISDFTKQPVVTTQNVNLPPPPVGFGLPDSIKGVAGMTMPLGYITTKGIGFYVYPGLKIFVNEKTGQAWQFIPTGYQIVAGNGAILTLKSEWIMCKPLK